MYPSTNYLVYIFQGWAAQAGGTVDGSLLENITAETNVYAIFTSATRYFTVRFINGHDVVYTQYVTYGSAAQYYPDRYPQLTEKVRKKRGLRD